jgi:hypothetical protein
MPLVATRRLQVSFPRTAEIRRNQSSSNSNLVSGDQHPIAKEPHLPRCKKAARIERLRHRRINYENWDSCSSTST